MHAAHGRQGGVPRRQLKLGSSAGPCRDTAGTSQALRSTPDAVFAATNAKSIDSETVTGLGDRRLAARCVRVTRYAASVRFTMLCMHASQVPSPSPLRIGYN